MMQDKTSVYEYIPGFLIAFSVLLSITSGIGFISYVGIYYWVLFRFDLVPVTLIGLLGLVYDTYSSPFLGMETSLFSIFSLLVYLEQRFLKYLSFNEIWFRFSFLMILIFGLKWLLLQEFGLPFKFLMQGISLLITLGIFPVYVLGVFPIYNRICS